MGAMGPPTILLVCLLAGITPSVRGCDCGSSKDAAQPQGNSLVPQRNDNGQRRGAPTSLTSVTSATSTLDDVLTPQLVQSYLALQLHRAAMDMADRAEAAEAAEQARSIAAARCQQAAGSSSGSCLGGGLPAESLRRAKRLAISGRGQQSDDVPVVAGLAGLGLTALPTPSALVALRPKASKNDDSNDVPVFKGNHEGTPLIRVVTPPPTAAARGAHLATTAPTVPVVKGSPDPAHPTTPRTSALLPGDLQLTPEEEEALAVLLEGRHHKTPSASSRPRPTSRPALRPTARPNRPTPSPAISGKVGSKPTSSVVPPSRTDFQGHRSSSSNNNNNGDGTSNGNCCSQKRLLQELERQLAILRQLNADHLREEWVRSSYPSPYYPYLHNLPVHPARGYDGAPTLLPTYYLPSSGWRRRGPGSSPVSWRPSAPEAVQQQGTGAAPDDCDDWSGRSAPGGARESVDAEDGGHLDDKVQFSEPSSKQQREVDDLQGTDPQDDVGVDPKIGDPVDFEIR